VLGRLSKPEAIPLLIGALVTAGDNDLRRAAISALGTLAAVEALDSIKPFLKNDDLSHAALIAVLQIGIKDKDAAIQVLRGLGREPKALVVRTLLGDAGAKKQYKALLKPGADLKNLLGALEFGAMLKDPEFEEPLSQLTKFRKHTNFPGDRYVSYLAVKALVGIKLAKAAEAPSGGGQA
jgi:HEAT repeat protein